MTDQILSKEYIDPFMGGYQRRIRQNRQPLFMAVCDCNAMPNLGYSLLANKHAIPLLGCSNH